MKTHSLRLAIVLMSAFVPGVAIAQHETHPAGAPQASPEMAQCARVQPAVDNIIAAAMARLESARQSNSAAGMRAAVDDLQGVLRDIRTQLSPCAAAAVAAADPDAGHTMPVMRQPSGAPAPANQTPAGAADPHAGHAMPATPGTPINAPTPKPSPSQSATDPHAGHVMPAASPAPKSSPKLKPAPGKPATQVTADPHAGHGSGPQQSEKQMDPVNGLMVDPSTAKKTTYQSQIYYFSSEKTLEEFLENPAKFAKKRKG
jgi:YHS domain-containing protein